MEFRIADTFTDSLARLTGEEQKASKTTAFDLQVNPTQPGLQFHKLEKAKDPNFWSVRVSRDLRIIVHRTANALLLCYVHHHDEAYRWAEKRRLETHPKTGAAQLVEIRERVEEIAIPKYVEVVEPAPKRKTLHNISEGTLLSYGVPPEWIQDVLNATEDSLLEIAGHLPFEAAEALLNLATGIRPPIPEPIAPGGNPFNHPEHRFSQRFLLTEWEQVVDAWQLDTWEEYRDVQRLGRRTRLKEPQRKLLWTIFEGVRFALRGTGTITASGMFNVLARHYASGASAPFDYCVVDEAQDISIAQLRFLAAIRAGRPNGLFFAGDLGQRIFQQPFSWKAAGVDVRGRSTTLKINYRTSHQIRSQADRLLEPQVQDVDGNVEERKGTISLFDGPKPDIKTFTSEADEIACVREWLSGLTAAALRPHEIALFARSASQLDRPTAAVAAAGLAPQVLDEHIEIVPGKVSIGTMHLAKGLEFRAVGVMACDDEVIPLQERIEAVTDDGDLEDVYNTERQLLYVACTRARDHLLVTGTQPASEFLDDLSR